MISFKSFLLLITYSFLNLSIPINIVEPTIGRWKLLYTNSVLYNKKNDCYLDIFPLENGKDKNKLSVEINRIEKKNILILRKKITSKTVCYLPSIQKNNLIKNPFLINNNKCSLVLLTSEKFIQSIGIFQIPYFGVNYKSEMRPEYAITWDFDIGLNRLYIYFDNNKYIFERNFMDSSEITNEKIITTNTFIISNLISFIFGKILENIFHGS
jgi:hypothetical protein